MAQFFPQVHRLQSYQLLLCSTLELSERMMLNLLECILMQGNMSNSCAYLIKYGLCGFLLNSFAQRYSFLFNLSSASIVEITDHSHHLFLDLLHFQSSYSSCQNLRLDQSLLECPPKQSNSKKLVHGFLLKAC